MLDHIKYLILSRYKRPGTVYIRSKTKYEGSPFVVISNNCWGAEIYKLLNLQYNTPFVGLFLTGPDFVKLLENFDKLIRTQVIFTEESRQLAQSLGYPVGTIDDIKIHFMHYKSENEAREKWERRVNRLLEVQDRSRILVKICDRDVASPELFRKFHSTHFQHKVSFAHFAFDHNDHISVQETDNGKTVMDGVKLFNVSNRYFDIIHWINTGELRRTRR